MADGGWGLLGDWVTPHLPEIEGVVSFAVGWDQKLAGVNIELGGGGGWDQKLAGVNRELDAGGGCGEVGWSRS